MAILVKKFGGSSVATPEKIHGIVNRVLKEKKPGDKIVIVVSAMGDSTDDLLALAGRVNPEMPKRELDMLLATGEQVTIALMAGAFWAKGQPAVSFTGAQAGIKTNDKYSKASIINVEAERVQKALDEGNVVIVAGFQGITGSGDITTLGRGGSDTTAVAIAAGLNAGICDIYTDVDGVYTADPRKVPDARKLDAITYDEMLELATLGAQVLNNRSVEMAKKYNVELEVLSSLEKKPGTIVKETVKMEKTLIRGVAKDSNVATISVVGLQDTPGVAFRLFNKLAQHKINVDIILQSVGRDGTKDITFTVPKDDGKTAVESMKTLMDSLNYKKVELDESVAKISVVGAGMESHPGVASKMFEALYDAGINIRMISTSEIKISVLIDAEYADKAVRAVHDAFIN